MKPRCHAMISVLLLAVASCRAPPPRAYYAPEGIPPGPHIADHRWASTDAILLVRCQGVYPNVVRRTRVQTVHMQMEISRPRAGELVVPRASLVVQLPADGDVPVRTLPVSEVWSGADPVSGDLVVPDWSQRPFDLFFDMAGTRAANLPAEVALHWGLGAGPDRPSGVFRFLRIPPDSPFHPSDDPVPDGEFGLRNGYYLPGAVHLGSRALQSSGNHRLHYLFHKTTRWGW